MLFKRLLPVILVTPFFFLLAKSPVMAGCDWYCEGTVGMWTTAAVPFCSQNPDPYRVWLCFFLMTEDPYSCTGCSSAATMCCEEGPCDPAGCTGCFTAETPIKTPNGEVLIKDINEGDTVIALDPETGETLQSTVSATYIHDAQGYYEIQVQDNEGNEKILQVTGEHPVYVKEGELPAPTVQQKANQLFNQVISSIEKLFN